MLFGQQHHCKGLADAFFSWVFNILRFRTVLGLNRLGELIRGLNTKEGADMDAHRLNPAALNSFSAMLSARYNLEFKSHKEACAAQFKNTAWDGHVYCFGAMEDLSHLSDACVPATQ